MTRPARIASQIVDRSAATLVAGLLVATLFGNAMMWAMFCAGRVAGS